MSTPRHLLFLAGPTVSLARVRSLVHERRPDLHVHVARDVMEAQRLLAELEGDLAGVLLDLDLPGVDRDLVLVRELAGGAARLPVVAMVADDELGAEAVAAGAVDHVDPDNDRPEGIARAVHYAIERAAADDRHRERADALAQANRILARYGRALSHDLKTPLAIAIGALETMGRYHDQMSDAELERLSDLSVGHLRGLAEHVDQLLDEAVLDSDEPLGLVNPVHVAQWAYGTLPVADRDRVHLRIEDVPRVRALKTTLRQVFQNVLANSVRHNPDGALALRVSGTVVGDMARIVIEDDGVGFPADMEGLIGDGHSAGGSTGLGLMTILLGIARMGGTVSFDRGELGGAAVVLTLPTGAPDEAEESLEFLDEAERSLEFLDEAADLA